MRWYEYKMETDDLYAPDDLKAKLLAMTDQLTEEEKAQPMMKTPAPARPPHRCSGKRNLSVPLPVKRVGTLAACLGCVRGGLWCPLPPDKSALAQRAAARRPIILRTALRRDGGRQAAWTAPLWTAPWPPITV